MISSKTIIVTIHNRQIQRDVLKPLKAEYQLYGSNVGRGTKNVKQVSSQDDVKCSNVFLGYCTHNPQKHRSALPFTKNGL